MTVPAVVTDTPAPGTAVAARVEVAEVPAIEPRRDRALDVEAALRLADLLYQSGFLPKAIKTPQQAFALILTGREMGLGPMASVRSIGIVDGKPVVAADLQLGLFKRAGGRAIFERLDDKGAVLKLRHPNGDEHTESFTDADARNAGLVNKDNWKRYPKAMYRSRVITAGLKSIGFEPMAGVYDPEELDVTPFRGDTIAAGAGDRGEGGVGAVAVTLDTAMPFGKGKATDEQPGKTVRQMGRGYFQLWVTKSEAGDDVHPGVLAFARAALDAFDEAAQGAAQDADQNGPKAIDPGGVPRDTMDEPPEQTNDMVSDTRRELSPIEQARARVGELLADERVPHTVRDKWRRGLDDLQTVQDYTRAALDLEAAARKAGGRRG